MVRKWLSIAEEVIRRDGGKKGGERTAPGGKSAKPSAAPGSRAR